MQYAVVFLIALGLAVLQLLHGGMYFAGLALPGYFVMALACALSLAVWVQRGYGKSVSVAFWFCLAAFAYLIWRAMETEDVGAARLQMFFLLGGAATFLAVTVGLPTWRARAWLVAAIVVLAVLQMGVGIWQGAHEGARPFPWASGILREWYDGRFGVGRRGGLFLNPNQLAWLLNIAGMFCFGWAVWSRSRIFLRVVSVVAGLALLSSVMLLTVSRGGLVAGAAGLVCFAAISLLIILRRASLRRWVAGAFLLMLFGVVVFALMKRFESDWALQARLDGSDIYVREQFMEAALRQAQLEPLLGMGAGSYESYFGRYRKRGLNLGEAYFTHNDWLQLVAEYGVLGLFAVSLSGGVLLFTGLVVLLRKTGEGDSAKLPFGTDLAILVGGISALATMVAHGFVDFNMQVPANGLLAIAVAGLVLPIFEVPRRFNTLAAYFNMGGVGLVVGVVCFLLFEVEYRHLPGEIWCLRGVNAQVAGKSREAHTAAEVALKLDQSNSRAWQLLGDSGLALAFYPMPYETRDLLFRQSYQAFRMAAMLQPSQKLYWFKSGEALARMGRGGQADLFFKTVAAAELGRGEVWLYLGAAAEMEGKYDTAYRYYRVAARLSGYQTFAHRRLRLLDNARKKNLLSVGVY
ncbi:MAG: O-antigen ligase family protein [Chthoniobacterales bacterium]